VEDSKYYYSSIQGVPPYSLSTAWQRLWHRLRGVLPLAAGRSNLSSQTTGNRPSQAHVTDSYIQGTVGTVILLGKRCSPPAAMPAAPTQHCGGRLAAGSAPAQRTSHSAPQSLRGVPGCWGPAHEPLRA